MTQRTLAPIPSRTVDPRTRRPAFGSYHGAFRRIDFDGLVGGPRARLLHEKRWVWSAVTTPDLLVAWAVVDLGYATNAFAFAWDAARGMVVDHSLLGVPLAGRVRQTSTRRLDARFVHPRGALRMTAHEGHPGVEVAITLPDLEVHATLDDRRAPPPISAVVPVPGGHVNATEKRTLMPVRGAALVGGRRISLDEALGGYDYTHGLLGRRTQWNWAFLMGRATSGERVALNVVEGFVGEAECALWVDDVLYPLPEGRFTFSRSAPDAMWRVRTDDGAVDLTFLPAGVHREHRDLGFVRARFVQPVGTFTGRVTLGGRTLELDRVPGVVEDQDVLW